MDLSKRKTRPEKIIFDYNNEKVTATIKRECLTAGFVQTLDRLGTERNFIELARQLSVNTIDWDITDNKKAVLPTFENLRDLLEIYFLIAFANAIIERVMANPTAQTNSEIISEQKAK